MGETVLTEEWWIVADAAFLAVVWPGSTASALALPSCQSHGRCMRTKPTEQIALCIQFFGPNFKSP
jgi:hypothetical protein